MESWVRLDNLSYYCEYGCDQQGIHCTQSSDVVEDSTEPDVNNAAHWHRVDVDYQSRAPSYLCDYHYEELILGVTHPTDDEIAAKQAFEAPSAEEFASRIGEVR